MPIRTVCPNCRSVYTLADELAGKKVRCKKCAGPIAVRAKADSEAEGDDEDSGMRQRIQARPRSGSAAARARRREREDEWDDEPSIRKSNSGLVIALVVGGLGLLLLLGGGILVIVLLINNRNANRPDRSIFADGGGQPPQGMFEDNPDADNAWPAIGMHILPPESVVLHIAGVADENTREEISEKLEAMGQTDRHFKMHSTHRGDRMTVLMVNVQDALAFSRKLDFCTIDSVKGRIVTVTARKVEGPPANADAVAKAVHRLKSPDPNKRREAARILKGALPDGRRAEVVRALVPLLNDADIFTRKFAVEALGVWGDKDAVPALIRAMQERETRRDAMEALARIKDERGAEAVAAYLEEIGGLLQATEALKKMGPIAEKAVLARLNHGEFQVRLMACEILKTIGTKKSIPTLETVVDAGKDPFSGQDHLVAMQATETIKAIKRRQ